jgi:hypothetical protein
VRRGGSTPRLLTIAEPRSGGPVAGEFVVV